MMMMGDGGGKMKPKTPSGRSDAHHLWRTAATENFGGCCCGGDGSEIT